MSVEPAFNISLPARLDDVHRLIGWLRSVTSSILRDDDFILLEIGVVELVNNIIEHGFETFTGTFDVTCELDGSRVTLHISDAGAAMPDGLQQRYDDLVDEVDLDATSGRGLGIMKKCFEQVRFHRTGGMNNVTAVYDPAMARI